jgi:hypothetical protein
LGFMNRFNQFVVEPGAFRVWIGPISTQGLVAQFEIIE